MPISVPVLASSAHATPETRPVSAVPPETAPQDSAQPDSGASSSAASATSSPGDSSNAAPDFAPPSGKQLVQDTAYVAGRVPGVGVVASDALDRVADGQNPDQIVKGAAVSTLRSTRPWGLLSMVRAGVHWLKDHMVGKASSDVKETSAPPAASQPLGARLAQAGAADAQKGQGLIVDGVKDIVHMAHKSIQFVERIAYDVVHVGDHDTRQDLGTQVKNMPLEALDSVVRLSRDWDDITDGLRDEVTASGEKAGAYALASAGRTFRPKKASPGQLAAMRTTAAQETSVDQTPQTVSAPADAPPVVNKVAPIGQVTVTSLAPLSGTSPDF